MRHTLNTITGFSLLLILSACGGGGGGQSFTITANAQSFSTDEDAMYIGNLTASTSSAATVTYQKVSGPTSGAINLAPDGGFSYNPQAEFSGSDSFQFTATAVENGTISSPATVSITINDPRD